MDLVIFEQNKPFVLETLGNGEFDYIEAVSEVFETDFFCFILFVPDNLKYEGSVKLLFDEHNHPIGLEQYKKMTEAQKSRCQWKRCYKMVTLLHTNRELEFFLFVALKVISGKDNECPVV